MAIETLLNLDPAPLCAPPNRQMHLRSRGILKYPSPNCACTPLRVGCFSTSEGYARRPRMNLGGIRKLRAPADPQGLPTQDD